MQVWLVLGLSWGLSQILSYVNRDNSCVRIYWLDLDVDLRFDLSAGSIWLSVANLLIPRLPEMAFASCWDPLRGCNCEFPFGLVGVIGSPRSKLLKDYGFLKRKDFASDVSRFSEFILPRRYEIRERLDEDTVLISSPFSIWERSLSLRGVEYRTV